MEMVICTADLTSMAPIAFNKPIDHRQKKRGEAADVFEARTWEQRKHLDADGYLIIPGLNLKNALAECAKYLSEKIPGKGQATYTKHFDAGVMVRDALQICDRKGNRIHGDKVEGLELFVPSDGVKGGGKRVYRTFPCVQEWQTSVTVNVFDPTLRGKPDKVGEYLEQAGVFIGLLAHRVRNGGYFGRFSVANFKHKKG